jgi:hypothetical protein
MRYVSVAKQDSTPRDAFGRSIPEPRPTAAVRTRWRAARHFQVAAQHALGMPFIEWLLLETLAELVDEANGPVSQAAVAERAGLSEKITSYWMGMLDELGFVDRGPDADGRAYRVLLSRVGEEALASANLRLLCRGLLAEATAAGDAYSKVSPDQSRATSSVERDR